MKKVPDEVLEFFKYDIESYSGHVTFLGKYDGKDVYTYEYDEEAIIGFPHVCLYKKDFPLESAIELESLRIIRKLKNKRTI